MIRYNVSITGANSHFIDIEMRLDKVKTPFVELWLPSWRPGRYETGNFAKNIRGWKAFDSKGNELPFQKTTKDCWKITTLKSQEITIRYQYFANMLNAGSCWVDPEHLYINGIHCFMYDSKRMEEPCEVTLEIPGNWKIACGMTQSGRNVLSAKDYHQLVDCPLIASPTLKHDAYESGGVTFNIWIQGECKPDWETILADFKSFTEEQLFIFESFPVKDYHFLIQVLPFPYYHGVEHTNSTVLAMGPGYDLMMPERYHELTGIACHELFHTWNIKTIRPADMLPYQYQLENYSRLGYIYEGMTTYYGDYLLGRCGVYTDEEFLAEMSIRLQNHMDNAGRFNYSVADSSFDTWLDGYVPGIPGRKTSIYDEGCLLALMLDLMIRKDTSNKKSLDDFFKILNKTFGKLKKGYTESDLIKILKQVSGKSYQTFFNYFVNAAVSYEQELNKLLNYVGCEITASRSSKNYESNFGFKVTQEGITKVLKVYPGSIADQAGLNTDDELISINGFKIENNLDSWCRYFDGEIITLDVSSNKTMRQVILKKAKRNYYHIYSIIRKKTQAKPQKLFFEKWMGR